MYLFTAVPRVHMRLHTHTHHTCRPQTVAGLIFRTLVKRSQVAHVRSYLAVMCGEGTPEAATSIQIMYHELMI